MTDDTAISRPFLDVKGQEGEVLNFMSDASASQFLSFGCVYDQQWTYSQWEPNFIMRYKPSIKFLEL